jgi:outer membrane protein OmpA-like peptidoglycan-associated protein
MSATRSKISLLASLFLVLSLATLSAATDSGTGKLKIHVSPKQAYVFVDGSAIRDGSQTIKLTPGSHEVSVHNYGYTPVTKSVDIQSGKTTDINVDLQKSGGEVSGPFGDIELKGDSRAAVLLNGTTPDYFVGHVDEFNWNWIWHQRLLVHPGTYNVAVTREGKSIWSGPVTVKAGEQVTVYLDHDGKIKTKSWHEGETMGPQQRFHAGIASAEVPIAPVTAALTAQSTSLNCGQSTQLNWNSADAIAVDITDLGNVPATGDRSVTPTKTTAYQLVAKGPGGDVTQTATVNVDSQPVATLTANEQEVHYHKIGDKVVEDGPVTLNWSASNADKVTITPLGAEGTTGNATINPQPAQTTNGPVDEVVNYTLSASNDCGGTITKTAALHVVGSIDPAPPVTLASVFYPSNYPHAAKSDAGLLGSEKALLNEAANRFKTHEEYSNDNITLVVVGHADVRGPESYNLQLSERRAELVKDYLVSQGIPADKIQIRAEGQKQELSRDDVAKLQTEDQQKPDKWMSGNAKATWMAYNRRVDIILEPAGQTSTNAYPNGATDARLLWQRAEPSLHQVESAGQATAPAQTVASSTAGN